MNRVFKNAVVVMMATVLMATGITGCTSKALPEAKTDTMESYIKGHSYELNFNDEKNFLKSFLDNKDYKIIVCGEQHNIDVNEELKLNFIKCLSENYDLKYYIGEFDYVTSIYFNKYLNSGKEEDLQFLCRISPTNTVEWYEGVKKTYEFYKSLPEDKKFKMLGLDWSGTSGGVHELSYLNTLIGNKNIPDDLQVINKLKDMNLLKDYDKRSEVILNIKADIKARQEKYQSFLGENYTDFYIIISSMSTDIEVNTLAKQKGIRDNETRMAGEKQIIENFNILYEKLPKGLYFGQWGAAHTNLSKTTYDGFIKSLNEKNSDLKGKILSIRYIYYGNGDDKLFNKLSTNMKGNLMLYKLDGENSPFKQNLIMKDFPIDTSFAESNLPISNYFQGIILIKSYKEVTQKKF